MLNTILNIKKDQPLNVLCLGAHSDDIEIGCGATILRLIAEHNKTNFRWIVFSASLERSIEAQSSAARFLKGTNQQTVEVKSYRDGYFPFVGDQIKDEFEQIKTEFAPDIILTHYRDDAHQDHRLINMLTWNSWRNHLILEYEIPKYDGDMGQPNFFVAADDNLCQNKFEIILDSFKSQANKQWFTEETFRSIMRLRGIEANASGGYAEAFYGRKILF